MLDKKKDSCEETVLLPTPPLPDKTNNLCLMVDNRSAINGKSRVQFSN